jgi:hypothetical protein
MSYVDFVVVFLLNLELHDYERKNTGEIKRN